MTWGGAASPANSVANLLATYDHWVQTYGEDPAKYLAEELGRWTETYSHGCLVEFDFLKDLDLGAKVQQICAVLSMGYWTTDFLVVQPGQKVVATFDDRIISAQE